MKTSSGVISNVHLSSWICLLVPSAMRSFWTIVWQGICLHRTNKTHTSHYDEYYTVYHTMGESQLKIGIIFLRSVSDAFFSVAPISAHHMNVYIYYFNNLPKCTAPFWVVFIFILSVIYSSILMRVYIYSFSNLPNVQQHSDPSSYAWCIIRYTAVKLILNNLSSFLPQIGIELQGIYCIYIVASQP